MHGLNKAELESNRKPFLLKKPNYLVIVWIKTVTKTVTKCKSKTISFL